MVAMVFESPNAVVLPPEASLNAMKSVNANMYWTTFVPVTLRFAVVAGFVPVRPLDAEVRKGEEVFISWEDRTIPPMEILS